MQALVLSQPRIQDLTVGCNIAGNYILQTVRNGICANGSPFLCGYLSDASGTINFIQFDYTGSISRADAGKIVSLDGQVVVYRGANQVHLHDICFPAGCPEDGRSLVPCAPVDICFVQSSIYGCLDKYVHDPDYRRLCTNLLFDMSPLFWTCPAAMHVHHAYVGGLAVHTANMMEAAGAMMDHYARFCGINTSLLMAGILFHDIGKLREFQLSDLGLVVAYSPESPQKNHSILGSDLIEEKGASLGIPAEKIEQLTHLILSHHGSLNLGAPVLPQCLEAELLSLLDSMDSTIDIYRTAYKNIEPGSSGYHNPYLGKQIFRAA